MSNCYFALFLLVQTKKPNKVKELKWYQYKN